MVITQHFSRQCWSLQVFVSAMLLSRSCLASLVDQQGVHSRRVNIYVLSEGLYLEAMHCNAAIAKMRLLKPQRLTFEM